MARKAKTLKRARLALFTAAFVICGIPPTTIGKIKVAQAESNVTLVGDGTVYNPYLIGSKAELNTFRDITVGENGQTRNNSACARLTANIDLQGSSSDPWKMIGTYDISYSGTFDGAGYTVSGVYINKPSTSYIGFFALLTNATVKNLTVSGSIIGARYVGGIVGSLGKYSTGNNTIYKCTNNCTVYSDRTPTSGDGCNVGGIAGYANGGNNLISSCVNNGNVSAKTDASRSEAGGILGTSSKSITIKNSINNGNVTAGAYVGGIGGYLSSTDTLISGCYNHGVIRANYDYHSAMSYAGGIGGNIGAARVEYCANTGDIYANGNTVGGLAGYSNTSTYFACYNTATVTAKTANGIVGSGYRLEISNCYNTGRMVATSPKSDISAGINSSSGSANYPLSIHEVFNTGAVVNQDGSTYPYTRRGSIAADPREGVVTNAYWLEGTYKLGIGYYETLQQLLLQ